MQGKRIRPFFTTPAEKIDTIQPELNLFAVQMVSQSQFFRGFYLLYLMRLPIYQKNFAQKDSSRLEYVMYNAKALIPCYSWNESTSRTTSWIAWAFF